MKFIENLDEARIAEPMEPKWIRADSLWSRIAGNMFFSTEEKKKIRFMIETEPGEDTTKKEKKKKEMNFDEKAVEIIRDYIVNHLDKSDPMPDFTVFTVWKCKVLQNWKYLLSSTLLDGMYYELTYNGDKKEWYLDAYKKFQNVVVKEND